MKPAPFHYFAPSSIAAATAQLSELAGEDARVLAGGQTLIPAMALRLARPSHLIDINGIQELNNLEVRGTALHIGACVRHAAFHRPVVAGPLGALLLDVVRHVAHLPIRYRGTFCGSLANADPAAEWCLVAATLDARLTACSARGEREIAATEFFRGYLTTALSSDELLIGAQLPCLSARERFGFVEFSRRAGDFAMAMSLVVLQSEAGRLTRVRIGVGGVEVVPRRIAPAEQCLEGQLVRSENLERAAEAAAMAIEPAESEEELRVYKRSLVRAAVLRALIKALDGQLRSH